VQQNEDDSHVDNIGVQVQCEVAEQQQWQQQLIKQQVPKAMVAVKVEEPLRSASIIIEGSDTVPNCGKKLELRVKELQEQIAIQARGVFVY